MRVFKIGENNKWNNLLWVHFGRRSKLQHKTKRTLHFKFWVFSFVRFELSYTLQFRYTNKTISYIDGSSTICHIQWLESSAGPLSFFEKVTRYGYFQSNALLSLLFSLLSHFMKLYHAGWTPKYELKDWFLSCLQISLLVPEIPRKIRST